MKPAETAEFILLGIFALMLIFVIQRETTRADREREQAMKASEFIRFSTSNQFIPNPDK